MLDAYLVLQDDVHAVEESEVPEVFRVKKGRLGLVDRERVFCARPTVRDIFDDRGIDRDRGCMVLVRPDQFVAAVLALGDVWRLESFCSGVFTRRVLARSG